MVRFKFLKGNGKRDPVSPLTAFVVTQDIRREAITFCVVVLVKEALSVAFTADIWVMRAECLAFVFVALKYCPC